MLLTDTKRIFLPLRGAGVVGNQAMDAVLDRAYEGYNLCEGLLPLEASGYHYDSWITWTDYNAESMTILLKTDRGGALDEVRGHIDAVRDYCCARSTTSC